MRRIQSRGGLSVDDGIVRTGGVCALATLNNKFAGWIFPYNTFCFDKPITKIVFDKDGIQKEMVVYDIIESLFVPICKLGVQSIEQLRWKITDYHFLDRPDFYSYSLQSLIISEFLGKKMMMGIDQKSEGFVFEIDIPAEIENIIHFGGKGWLCLAGN